MDSKNNRQTGKNRHFYQSLEHALDGLITIFKTERNFRFHCFASIIALMAAWLLKISASEWIAILTVITLVLTGEIFNTIVERVVDLIVGQHYNTVAKNVKDMAAGLVTIMALLAAIVGLVIFIPHLIFIFKG